MTNRKGKNNRHGSKRNFWSSMAIFIIAGFLVYAWYSYENRYADRSQIAVNSSEEDNEENILNGSAAGSQNQTPETKTEKANSAYEIGKLMRVNGGTDMASQILQYPGFTVSFNPDYHQPNYVVWELTREEALSKKVKRTNNFQPDINVQGCADPEDYRNSGYDRGHMAPSGDMKWDLDAMNACFLMTNMSPQTNALNSGIWNKLEEKCRDWAVRDGSLIIVCGPVLTDRLKKKIGKSGIPVPERYFKVILAPYADPPRGIGFVMPNSKSSMSLQETARSIDEIELITGFDFFSDLPDKVENAMEQECNYAKWTKRH